MSASASGTTPLAPMPVSKRHQIIACADCAVAVSAVRNTNAVSDANMIGRRPNRSEINP
jgi:hypothetical protein